MTHHWKQYCLEVWKTLKKFDWKRRVLMAIIQKKYELRSFNQPNTFYLWWQVSEYDTSKAITIISPFHSCEFIVSAFLVKEIWLREIFWWLFDRSMLCFSLIHETLKHAKHDYQAWEFWKQSVETISFPIKHIMTRENLIQESMIITSVLKDTKRQASAISSLHWLRNQWVDWEIHEVSGNGIDTDREIAHEKACSEARERNACGWIGWALPPDHTVPIAKDIVGLYCWTGGDINDEWYPISQWWTNKQRAIPGQILFYPYAHGHLWKGNSNGVACHTSMQDAFENGLFELIERDAFVLRRLTKQWWKCLIPNDATRQLIAQTTWWLCYLALYILEFGVLPVVLWIAKTGKKIVVAAWTGYTLEQAIQKACTETKQFLHHLWADPQIKPTDDSIMRHIKWYLDENHYDAVERIRQSESIHEDEESHHRNQNTSLSDLQETLTQQWVTVYIYSYNYYPLTPFWRVCLRVLSSHHLPIRFWKQIPQWILCSPRIRNWMNHYWVTKLNTSVHPFG